MKIWILVLAVLLAAVLTAWLLLLRCRRGHAAWTVLKQYRYAHRGYHDKPTIPENSMAAFRRAVEKGFGAELDVHLMKDGTLGVIHDSSLKRTAGADVRIEDLNREDLIRYPLEESEEIIPVLEDVLALFEKKTPLIIELKPERNNHNALCQAVAERLDRYEGDYCIESFDPRVVGWFRKHRPDVCRGQLAHRMTRKNAPQYPAYLRFICSNMLLNFWTRPDFVAYQFSARKKLSVLLCRWIHRPVQVAWTLRTMEELKEAEAEGMVGIFERFDPNG